MLSVIAGVNLWLRTRRRALLIGLALALTLSIAGMGGYLVGDDNRTALAAAMRDPLSILAQRSPGGRGVAILRSKPGRAAAVERGSQVVPKSEPIVDPEQDELALEDLVAPLMADASDPTAAETVSAYAEPALELATAGALPFAATSGGGAVAGGGGGGGGGATPSNPGGPELDDTQTLPPINLADPHPPLPPGFGPYPTPDDPRKDPPRGEPPFTPFAPPGTGVGAVPEPSTWATMILGFFAIGAMIRRARKSPRSFRHGHAI